MNNENDINMKEILEIMDNHDDDSEMEKRMESNDEGFCSEYEFELKEEHIVQEVRYLKDKLKSEIHENKTKKLINKEIVNGCEYQSRMRLDLWCWTERKGVKTFWLVEVIVAGEKIVNDETGDDTNTLKEVYMIAEEKFDKE
jgi:hypothetical protein